MHDAEARRLNARGSLWLLLSAVCFTVETSLLKVTARECSPQIQLAFRQAGGLLAIAPLLATRPMLAFRVRRPGVMMFRSVLGTTGLFLSILAIQHLSLAQATTLSFTRIIWISILSAMVLREQLIGRHLVPAVLGFIAVVVIERPSLGLGTGDWAGLAAAVLFAATIVAVKVLTRTELRLAIITYASILGLLFSLPFAIAAWQTPTLPTIIGMLAAGAVGMLTQVAYVRGLELGNPSAIAPVDYMRLVFAVLVGYIFFREELTLRVVVGLVLIIGSTYFLIRGLRATPPLSLSEGERSVSDPAC